VLKFLLILTIGNAYSSMNLDMYEVASLPSIKMTVYLYLCRCSFLFFKHAP